MQNTVCDVLLSEAPCQVDKHVTTIYDGMYYSSQALNVHRCVIFLTQLLLSHVYC